jgi:hypothetical protein
MQRWKWIGSMGVSACLLAAACSDMKSPIGPAGSMTAGAIDGSRVTPTAGAGGGHAILLLDECDPDSFNEAIGPGSCVNRNGGLTFDVFIALLEKHARVPSWRFSSDSIHVPAEMTLPIANRGGEVHTFTEVAEFGGGIVPQLNALAGTPVPAPECLTLVGSDFVPSGGQTSHTFEPGEQDKYQCCIHPWMRASTH